MRTDLRGTVCLEPRHAIPRTEQPYEFTAKNRAVKSEALSKEEFRSRGVQSRLSRGLRPLELPLESGTVAAGPLEVGEALLEQVALHGEAGLEQRPLQLLGGA